MEKHPANERLTVEPPVVDPPAMELPTVKRRRKVIGEAPPSRFSPLRCTPMRGSILNDASTLKVSIRCRLITVGFSCYFNSLDGFF